MTFPPWMHMHNPWDRLVGHEFTFYIQMPKPLIVAEEIDGAFVITEVDIVPPGR